MKSLFITGTDTGVGKTVVAALFMAYAAELKKSAHYHKPIQTACESDCDASMVASLIPEQKNLSADYGLALKRPLSPHLSARYQNISIDFHAVIRKAEERCQAEINIIEGAGGLLVPITQDYLMTDLMKALDLPVVLVARSTLGTINHTLLSLEALKSRAIKIAGIVMVGPPNADNEEAISFYGQAPLIMSVPFMPIIDHRSIESFARAQQSQMAHFFK